MITKYNSCLPLAKSEPWQWLNVKDSWQAERLETQQDKLLAKNNKLIEKRKMFPVQVSTERVERCADRREFDFQVAIKIKEAHD